MPRHHQPPLPNEPDPSPPHQANKTRTAIARLAAAYGHTDAGRTTIAAHLDLTTTTSYCRRLGLTGPADATDLTVRPGIAHLEATLANPALKRSITCSLPIRDATLPRTRQSMTVTAGDRTGPRLLTPHAADYLALPAKATEQLLDEVRTQLTTAAAALYRTGTRLHEQHQRNPPTARQPDLTDTRAATRAEEPAVAATEVWEPTPEAIDAISELLEQDARWKATMLINDWYIRVIDRVQQIELVQPHQPVQIDHTGLRATLPAGLCELLNEHWRATYTRTINQQLHIIDALDTPGENAMRAYLDAQELREARDATSGDFPPPAHDQHPDEHGQQHGGQHSGERGGERGEHPHPGSPPGRQPDHREDGDDLER